MSHDEHPFAFIAPGPYKYLGVTEEIYQAHQGAPIQAAGMCDRCAQSIRYAVRWEASDGTRFATGQDCAYWGHMSADAIAQYKRDIRDARRAVRDRSGDARATAAERKRQRWARELEQRAARMDFASRNAILIAGLLKVRDEPAEEIGGSTFPSDIAGRYLRNLAMRIELDEAELETAERLISEQFARAAAGTPRPAAGVQGRATWSGTIVGLRIVESQWGAQVRVEIATDEGSRLVAYSSSTAWRPRRPWNLDGKLVGQRVKFKATVKAQRPDHTLVTRIADQK